MNEPSQQPISPLSRLDEIEARYARFNSVMKAAEARSKTHSQNSDRRGYFFLLQGLRELDGGQSDLLSSASDIASEAHREGQFLVDNGLISLQPVDNFPGQIHLQQALTDQCAHYMYQVLGRPHARLYELFISSAIARDASGALKFAHRVLYLLRAKAGCFFTVPFWSDTSWNQIAGKNKQVFINPIALEESKTPLLRSGFVSSGDFNWTVQRVRRTFELYEAPAFRLAFDPLNEAPFQSTERMSVATSWAGLESLLGIDQELSYRIAMYLAVLLSDDPESRVTIRNHVRKLYGLRSKAVHGAGIKEAVLVKTAEESWVLLRDIVMYMIDSDNDLPTPETFDRLLLGAPPV